jgi:subtilisin family serine protease
MIKQKKFLNVSFILALVVFLLGVFLVKAEDPSNDKGRIPRRDDTGRKAPNYAEGEVLVKFRVGVSRSDADRIADSYSFDVKKHYSAITMINGFEYAHLKSKDKTTEQMIEELSRHPDVVYVSPNYRRHTDQNIPNDTRFNELWGMHNTGQTGGTADIDINAPEAWDINTGSSSVIVAVVDTGIDYNHPDLQANMWVNPYEIAGNGIDDDANGVVDDIHGINAIPIPSTGDPMDDNGHGTHCSGTIGGVGNNSLGVAGVCWDVSIIGCKSFDASGSGWDSDAIECIDYLINLKSSFGHNIVAINASWGSYSYNALLKDAIDAAGAVDIIFCAAAGNDDTDNDTTPHYPSSYTSTNIIAVTGVDHDGNQVYNYGATSVDIGAPGVFILSTVQAMYWPQPGDIFFDNMESGAGQWTTGGTLNTWAITTNQEGFANYLFPVPSPPNFWSDSPGVDYSSDTDSWLMNASNINLSSYVGQDVYIGFGSAMLIENYYDHGYVQVSGDGGSSWTTLMDFSGYGYYWLNPYSYLIPDAVKTANFRFRFRLVSDFIYEYWGWLIDDVGIGTDFTHGYSYKNGTSMATPHVTGAVALAAAYNPLDTAAQRIARILTNVTPLSSLTGKCTTEGMLNLYDTITSILPSAPENPTPANGATDVAVDTTLDWDDCVATTEYDVYLDTTSPPSSLVDTVTDSSYDPGTLDYDETYYWKIVARNAGGETSGPEWNFSTESAGAAEKNDFNGDGQGDILWRHYGNGKNAVWYMEYTNGAMAGLGLKNFGMMGMVQDLGQVIIYQDPMEAGDLVYKNEAGVYSSPMDAAGLVYQIEPPEFDWEKLGDAEEAQVLTEPGDVGDGVVRIQGLAIAGTANLCTLTDTNWQIEGTGDFNGDGKVDILWRNYADGKNSVWYMDGVAVIGGANLCTVTDTNWQIEGTGDFNGDTKVDILWRHYANGKNSVWYMNGVAVIGGANLCSVTDTNWKIEGTGDFNGDEKVDILWRHYANGKNSVWYMNGVAVIGGTNLCSVADTNWKIENH